MQKAVLTQSLMLTPEATQVTYELHQVIVGIGPINPADFVVLTIGVVVALLAIGNLVASQQHRATLTEKQCSQKIPLTTFAARKNDRIFRIAFHAAIVAIVGTMTVHVVFAIGVIVAIVVARDIRKRETIMGGK